MEIRQSNPSDIIQLITLLSQLTEVGNPRNIPDHVFENIYVAIMNDKIIGCATILIEDKIIHDGSKVGHIEDVVVHHNYRKSGIGKLLIDNCVKIAKQRGCYKVILDCDEHNVKFYEKCGFRTHGVCMRLDL